MGKRDDTIKAFKETAEQSTFQRRWLPTKTWVDAIDHVKQQRFAIKMVSRSINFFCEFLGSKSSTTDGEFVVFHEHFEVNTGSGAACKQTVHFYYVQPTTKDKLKVLNDIRYWQQQYNKFLSMRQPNSKQKAGDAANTKIPHKLPRNVDKPLATASISSQPQESNPDTPIVPLKLTTPACKKAPPRRKTPAPSALPKTPVQIVVRSAVTPTAGSPASQFHQVVTSPAAAAATVAPPQFSQAFHDYLVNRVEIQTIKHKEWGSENKGLTNDNNFLTGTNKQGDQRPQQGHCKAVESIKQTSRQTQR
jgi:hypothetical protein